MVKEYPKGQRIAISEHFRSSEMDCHCQSRECTVTYVDTDLIDALELLREKVGAPIVVTSGYRCSSHNRAVGGKPGSVHMTGKAADVLCEGVSVDTIRYAAESIPAFDDGGIGRYDSFTHLDTRNYRARWRG